MATRYTIAAGAINDAGNWNGELAIPSGVTGDVVQIRHAMTVDGAAYARFPAVGAFASLDLAAAGGESPGLVVTGVHAIAATAITGLENLNDYGGDAQATLTVTATSCGTTLDATWTTYGITDFSCAITCGGPAASGGIIVNGTLTAPTVTGIGDGTSYGIYNTGTVIGDVIGTGGSAGVDNEGEITGDVIGISTIGYGVESYGPITADTITAQSTSNIAFLDEAGTLTESTGAAGVNLSVRRLDGGQAVEIRGTTITDELKITYVSNSTTPLVI